MRRGRATANAAFGNAASVLVGDFLYSRAFQMMVSVGSMPVMAVLADATNTIAEGEVLQLLNMHDADVTVDAYLEVIRRKTAKLFEAAGRLGEQQHQSRPDPLAAGTDDVARDLIDQRHLGAQPLADERIDLPHGRFDRVGGRGGWGGDVEHGLRG